MKFALLMYSDPAETAAMSRDQLREVGRKHERLRAELTAAGILVAGAGMGHADQTTTVRLSGGAQVAGPGPLSAAREQLTAYYVLECASSAEAVGVAERIVDFHVTSVEVRHVHDSFGMVEAGAGVSARS
ncbi:YciI family protein [Catellatospora sp. TT07R-123]|uniref:YciI family protein n=1 Tax=Catellatospora sp. TT07R-123 TaxID=2733863 RepID=UPI001BB43C57|nr:YciI family protein [Catellatospora sp. TT07R-123]